jgi:hypothetical protein
MSYFVRKGNRCKTCNGDCVTIIYESAESSSSRSSSLARLTLKQTELGSKRGSGGNSYSDYIRRKVGLYDSRCCS